MRSFKTCEKLTNWLIAIGDETRDANSDTSGCKALLAMHDATKPISPPSNLWPTTWKFRAPADRKFVNSPSDFDSVLS